MQVELMWLEANWTELNPLVALQDHNMEVIIKPLLRINKEWKYTFQLIIINMLGIFQKIKGALLILNHKLVIKMTLLRKDSMRSWITIKKLIKKMKLYQRTQRVHKAQLVVKLKHKLSYNSNKIKIRWRHNQELNQVILRKEFLIRLMQWMIEICKESGMIWILKIRMIKLVWSLLISLRNSMRFMGLKTDQLWMNKKMIKRKMPVTQMRVRSKEMKFIH